MSWGKPQLSLQAKLNLLSLVLFASFVTAATLMIHYKIDGLYEKRKNQILTEKKQEVIQKIELIHQLAGEVYAQNSTTEAIEQEYRKKLVSVMDATLSIIQRRYEWLKQQGWADSEIQNELKDILRHLRYDDNVGYIFTYDFEGTLVSHADASLDGKNLYNTQDAKDFFFVREMVNIGKTTGQGFVHYHWRKLGHTEPKRKISYMQLFEPYNWILGTGIYIEDAEDLLAGRIARLITMHRYDIGDTKGNYFFIVDMAGKMILNPAFSQYNNLNTLDLTDIDNKQFIKEMIEKAQLNATGSVAYQWGKPHNTQHISPKITYFKKFEPFNWLIATGVYMDDLGLEAEYKALETEATNIVSAIIVIGIIFLLFGIAASLVLVNLIVKPLVDARYAAKEIAHGNFSVRIPYHAQDEIGQLTSAINSMAQQLQESFDHLVQLNQEKNEFLGIAAHDLKNPLSAIRGYAEDIQDSYHDIPTVELVEMARMIQTSAKRMFDLITNLLDVNAIESGNINLTREQIDLLPVVQNLLQEYQPRAQSKLIDVHLGAEQSSYLAYADANAAHQVLDNVLSNAIKYSPFNRNIYVRLNNSAHYIVCEIEDEGQGLSSDEQAQIFDKFTRLSPKPTAGEHSTGLGMFIVKKLVEKMEGKIHFQSAVGVGTTFTIRFPKH